MIEEIQDEVVDVAVTSCETTTAQKTTICLPVTVKPYAKVGTITTNCCGKPVVTQGTDKCSGTVGATCSFTIAQTICIEVPVEFGAETTTGDAAIACGDIQDNCNDCK